MSTLQLPANDTLAMEGAQEDGQSFNQIGKSFDPQQQLQSEKCKTNRIPNMDTQSLQNSDRGIMEMPKDEGLPY